MDTQNIQQPVEPYRGKGALDAFFNLTYLVTLGWTAISFGGVIFQIINKYFAIGNYVYGYESYYTSVLRFHLASLIIVMPIFLIITGILHKQYKEHKLNFQSGIHRWLTYLMLFIAFCNIIGGLIAVVNAFLKGDFFSSFILKAVTVLVIALGVFGYNFYDLRRKDFEAKSQVSIISLALVIILTVAAIIGAFVIMGSPAKARLYEYDNQRVNDLSSLRGQIQYYYDTNKKLPVDLSDPQLGQFKDPDTKQPYEYQTLGDKQFQLCANFSLDASLSSDGPTPETRGMGAWYYHKTGRQCYKLEAQDQQGVVKPIPGPIPVPNH